MRGRLLRLGFPIGFRNFLSSATGLPGNELVSFGLNRYDNG